VDLVDYEAIRNSIDGIANKLFKQDGTVELLVCRWSEKGGHILWAYLWDFELTVRDRETPANTNLLA